MPWMVHRRAGPFGPPREAIVRNGGFSVAPSALGVTGLQRMTGKEILLPDASEQWPQRNVPLAEGAAVKSKRHFQRLSRRFHGPYFNTSRGSEA